MAPSRRRKRVLSSRPATAAKNTNIDGKSSTIKRKKRVNKNKKKNWNKFSDINDVEEFLDDVRLQEKVTGGLLSEKPDDSLFFVDVGEKPTGVKTGAAGQKRTRSKPLRIDLILQPDSRVPVPKDVLSHQQPNAKKLRRMAEKAAKLASRGVLPRRSRARTQTRQQQRGTAEQNPASNSDPTRGFYDLWLPTPPQTDDLYYLEQTKKQRVKRPQALLEKPSTLAAVEVIAPGGSYNPDFFSHQDLLREAHEVELKKLKAEEKLTRQLAVHQEMATEESSFKEQVEGLIEEEESTEDPVEPDEESLTGASATCQKKSERQRKKEKADRVQALQRKAERQQVERRQQLFQLRSICTHLKQQEAASRARQQRRREEQEAEKSRPRRLGRLKFTAPDLDVQLSDELASSLRGLKPEGSILKERFKSLQKRNIIEPRERAKFFRKYKLQYKEKREFKEIQ